MQNRKQVLLLLPLLLLLSCAGKNQPYVPHPGSVDVADSKMYDSLLFWRGALEQAKQDYAEGKIPPNSKGSINAAGEAYNGMRNIWLAYRSAKQAGNEPDAQAQAARWAQFAVNMDKLVEQIIRLTL